MPINEFVNGELIEDIRAQIDKDLEAGSIVLRELKCRRNALAPVSRLPPELLSKIFLVVRLLAATSEDPRIMLDWIALTQVCQVWREVALNTPILWDCIDVMMPRWTLEMLERSKEVPLDVRALMCTESMVVHGRILEEDDPPPPALGHFFCRIRSLFIQASFIKLKKLLRSMTAAAPSLESLNLHSIGQLSIPERIFNRETPRLRQLYVDSCDGFWHLQPENLTRLVVLFPKTRSMSLSPEEFLRKISMMPLLEELVVSNYWDFRSRRDSATSPADVVPLRHLRNLSIACETDHCLLLFNHLSFPGNATMSLQVPDLSSPVGTHLISAVVKQYGTNSDRDPWLSVYMRLGPSNDFGFEAWPVCCSRDEHLENEVPALSIHSSWTDWTDEPVKIMKQLCSLGPAEQARTLILDNFNFSVPYSLEILMGFPGVHSLRVLDLNVLLPTLIYHLRQTRIQPKEDQTILFPNLHTMEFDRSPVDVYCEHSDTYVHLMDFLVERHRQKAGLKLLHLRECRRISEEDVIRMKELVDVVDWEKFTSWMDDVEDNPDGIMWLDRDRDSDAEQEIPGEEWTFEPPKPRLTRQP